MGSLQQRVSPKKTPSTSLPLRLIQFLQIHHGDPFIKHQDEDQLA
jgi:hypothetical protein